MNKSEVLALGYWPEFFTANLVGEAPSLSESTHTKLTWLCPNCGNEYQITIGHKLQGRGCPKCSRSNAHKRCIDPSLISDIHPDYLQKAIQGEISRRTKVPFICDIHGEYTQTLASHLLGCRCPNCRVDALVEGAKQARLKDPDKFKRKAHVYLPDHYNIDLSEIHPDDIPLLGSASSRTVLRFVCPEHGIYYQTAKDHFRTDGKASGCPDCAVRANNYGSKLENKLLEDLKSYGIECFKDRALIKPFELDIYIPDHHIAIEVNGSYYHSDRFIDSKCNSLFNGKTYHKLKSDRCKAKGVQLLHFHYGELRYKYDICLNKILSLCNRLNRQKVYGRKCQVRLLDSSERAEFLNRTHIQGDTNGLTYGLFYKDKLLSCMGWRRSQSNTVECGSYELNRYASDPGYFVIGGFEKLLKAFIKDHPDCKRIISFADLRLSSGAMYEHQGFVLESISDPDYQVITRDDVPHHKFNFRVDRFKNSDYLYQEGLTEFQLEDLNHLFRVWNCGLAKYVLTL